MIINKDKNTDQVIIFLHILKTAGMTLNGIIRNHYENKYRIEDPYWMQEPFEEYLAKFDTGTLNKLEVLRGHFHFGVHESLPQKKYTYITLLRNPIEQVISYYYFTRTRYPGILDDISFDEYLKDDEHNWRTSNLQTRFLSGTTSQPGDLETAKKNLEQYFSVVGITERFEESLSVMKQKFGWRVGAYDNKNVIANRPKIYQVSDEALLLIRQKNQDDIKLYEFANKLLDKSLLPESNNEIQWINNI